MKIVIIGLKATGKTTNGKRLAEYLNFRFFDLDKEIEKIYQEKYNKAMSFREIYKQHGKDFFRELEELAAKKLENEDFCVISTGGSAFLNPVVRFHLRNDAIIMMLDADNEILWERIIKEGIPAYLEKSENPKEEFFKRSDFIREVITPFADIIVKQKKNSSLDEDLQNMIYSLEKEFAIRMTSANTFGEIIRVTTFGESHGKALGVVLDGVKPGIPISEEDIQKELDRRKPGQSIVSTPRKESDKVEILSGVFEGKTTGTPIAMIVYNKDQNPSHYEKLRDLFRPGHADFTFYKKYGIRDHRGGGRSSGRETVSRVAAGAIAKKVLKEYYGIDIFGYTHTLAGVSIKKVDYSEIERNIVRAPDRDAAIEMVNAVEKARMDQDSVGGVVKLDIFNVPAGLGDPVFYKLDARLSHALVSLGAVKGIAFGNILNAPFLRGSVFNDQMSKLGFLTNNSGGIQGGISNGEPIEIYLFVRPTPSISKKQKTIDKYGNEVDLEIEGRHDPSICPRLVPVAESMAALVLWDAILIQERIRK